MPKKSKVELFWETRPTPQVKFFATDDLVLLEVKVDKTAIDQAARFGTVSDLMQLENFLKRGWQIVTSTPFENARYKVIAYTLYKPIDRKK